MKNNNFFIDNLHDLKKGQPLIHINHGVGRYYGLKVLKNNQVTTEYLVLSYANNTKLYVPIYSLYLVKKYINKNNQNIPLHTLGNNIWLKNRKKIVSKIQDTAVELLEIYAQRLKKKGFSFNFNDEKYSLFCKKFNFTLTKDQESAINEVIKDMIKPSPMDRLICGDVGFGKTEVAMRAAFIAIENHKQVALLTPTTLLAQQHLDNFKKRFITYEVKIEMLSRFRSIQEEKKILEEIFLGKTNIIIGTHKILNKKIKWNNLGLLIIDEEHRFGVRDKEKIKIIKHDVDIITLTATPIPRTLNMAMQGIRDLSIITTPPAHRLEIKTYICKYDKKIIRKAILKEVHRGGQVYYLYNNVDNIKKTAQKLKKLIPEANISIGHGKMKERDLEKVMNDFYHNKFNVLVCTTIIETGIDISNANTILIENANKFGLAQLHQLRGRVGRSNKQAYAWLLTPNSQLITEDAKKRLEAISNLEELGSGFTLSMQDLEIRGAGEILGKNQSGQIKSIGLFAYMEILEQAIRAIKKGKKIKDIDQRPDIDINISSIIPNDFIPNLNTRLNIYKKISNVNNEKNLKKIKNLLIYKFGKLPIETNNLIKIALLRIISQKIGIKKIKWGYKSGIIEFSENSKINYDLLISIIQKKPKEWRIENSTCIKFYKNDVSKEDRIMWILNLLNSLKIQ